MDTRFKRAPICGTEDKYWKANPALKMFRQVNENLCVTSIMEYVNHEFGGAAAKGDFINYYHGTSGKWAIINGVDLSDISSLTDHFFTTAEFSSYQSSIDNGNPVMTCFITSISGNETSGYDVTAHNVLVIGYNSGSGNLIYMDPILGTITTAAPSKFYFYQIPLTGIKK